MRYIDADELIKNLDCEKLEARFSERDIVDMVESRPTADVISREKYDRLMENAKIMCDALKEYERREDEQIH